MINALSPGDYVVYPTHGVGQFIGVETYGVGEETVRLIVISFQRDRMTLKLPEKKVISAGLRPLSSSDAMQKALEKLGCKVRQKRVIWNRRAQEYETKINSGNPEALAEVIRDLFKSKSDTEQSYSERQIYQIAVERLSRELAIVQEIEETVAIEQMETLLKAA